MAKFGLETMFDASAGLCSAAAYYPDDAISPVLQTKPMFRSYEEAASHVVDILKKSTPDKKSPA